MLVNLSEILNLAQAGGFAIPAFNVYNLETLEGVFEAAEEARAPIIIQCYSRLFAAGDAYFLAPSILAAAKRATVPICFHLDHGAGEKEVTLALRYGCTGIMIDGSALDYANNAAITKRVCKTCGYAGIPVEGELGHVGSTKDSEMAEYTNVEEAARFAKETGVAALAILVGTAHGRYKQAPKLDIERIAAIADATSLPLVLHGGSGVGDDQIRAAIAAGIRKINFGTDVCYSFLDTVFDTSREIVAVDLFMKDAIAAVSRFALEKIRLLGAEGKA